MIPVVQDASANTPGDASPKAGEARFRALRNAFEEVVDLPPEAQRQRLGELAAGDPNLAAEVSAWLAADQQAGGETPGFLAQPVGEYAPKLVEDWLVQHERPERLGPYRIVELLGAGGMGEVYLAERDDGQFEQQVAVKVLKLGVSSKEVVRRFFRERQILARLEHPNIARLFDGGLAEDGRPYFVMERVVGKPLPFYCQARALDLAERLRLMVTCCRAVAAAHRRLVVHRDLKPSNILVSAEGEVKVLDFGIAKLLDPAAEEEGITQLLPGGAEAMTPAYAAPEQILGEPITATTDVYALGVLLFEILTGNNPHRRDTRSLPELARQLDKETTTRPSAALRRVGVPASPIAAHQLVGDLDAIVGKAMHREPERRYASADALADELERFLAGRPVEARPDSWSYRSRKFIGRHRLGVVAALLVVASLVVGVVMALSQARRADAEAAMAKAQAERAERVKEFVLAIFREASPMTRRRDQPATAEELLAAGVARAKAELAGEPALAAEILSDLAGIQSNIRPSPEALVLAEEAVELARTLDPAQEPILVGTLSTLSDIYASMGRPQDAEQASREAVGLAGRLWGEHHVETAGVRAGLAVSLIHQSRYQEAVSHLVQVVADLPRNDPRFTAGRTLQMQNLAAMLVATGRPGEGAEAFAELLPTLEEQHGAGHFRLGVVQVNLAEAWLRHGDLDRAGVAVARALAIFEQQVGREHPLFCHSLIVAGGLETERRHFERAKSLFAEAATTLERATNPGAARAHFQAGLSAMASEDWAAAVSELESGREALTRLGHGDGQLFWLISASLAQVRARSGDPAADRELERAVARVTELSSAEDEERVLPLLYLGELEVRRGRNVEARKHYQAALDLALASYGERYPLTQEAKRWLAEN